MIRKVKNPIEVQETYIYTAPLEPDGTVLVCTTEPNMLKKMWDLHKKYPHEVTIKHDDKYGTDFHIPPDWVNIKPKKRLTEEQKKELAKRFQQRRSNTGKKKK